MFLNAFINSMISRFNGKVIIFLNCVKYLRPRVIVTSTQCIHFLVLGFVGGQAFVAPTHLVL